MANLFSDKKCHVCNGDIYPDMQSNNPENGFHDQDTGQFAHMKCRKKHYEIKNQNGMSGLYSEMPIIFYRA